MGYNVSIIINSYKNKNEDLIRSINSCLSQQGVDVEILVSTVAGDPAVGVVNGLNDNRIKLVMNDKPSIFGQINKAVKEITKGWFFYFSGNDICLPTKARREMDLCASTKAFVCYSAFYSRNELVEPHTKSVKRFAPYDYKRHFLTNFVSDCAMVRVDILRQFMPFVEKWGNYAYYDLWLRIAEKYGSRAFVYNNNPEWIYRIEKDSKHVLRRKNPQERELYHKIKLAMLRSHQ